MATTKWPDATMTTPSCSLPPDLVDALLGPNLAIGDAVRLRGDGRIGRVVAFEVIGRFARSEADYRGVPRVWLNVRVRLAPVTPGARPYIRTLIPSAVERVVDVAGDEVRS